MAESEKRRKATKATTTTTTDVAKLTREKEWHKKYGGKKEKGREKASPMGGAGGERERDSVSLPEDLCLCVGSMPLPFNFCFYIVDAVGGNW